jgi:hypothetical protein
MFVISLYHAPLLLLRSVVILALVAVAGCGRSTVSDQVILRDGGAKRGELSACDKYACTLSGTRISRPTIVLIGLNGAKRTPKIRDALHDEVQLTDESILAEEMTGIDDTNVVTEQGTYPRERVAWIYLAPGASAGAAGAPSKTGADSVSYEWSGTIGVQNQYDGREGYYQWQAVYTVTFLEAGSGSVAAGEAGRAFHRVDIVPVGFAYEIQADENLDKHTYSPGSVTLSGHASGQLTAEETKQRNVLRGQIIRIEEHPPAGTPPGTSVESESEYYRYLSNINPLPAPGWFTLSIGFTGFINNYSFAKLRALYSGIQRGGKAPPFFEDLDHDFVHWVPAMMLDRVTVIGRLDDADQGEVHGSTSFLRQGPGDAQDREQIKLTWQFQRKRQ